MTWHEKVSLESCICSQNAAHAGFDPPIGICHLVWPMKKNGPPPTMRENNFYLKDFQ